MKLFSDFRTVVNILLSFLFLPISIFGLPAREKENSGTIDQPSQSTVQSFTDETRRASPPLETSQLPAEFQGQTNNYREFSGDFSRSLISFSEVLSGGPPKDGIPAIDSPEFISAENLNDIEWLQADESVLVYEGESQVRVYPIQILTYHEIVNDEVDGLPIAVTYCPLCNTGVAFAAIDHEGTALDFGVSGRLRYSNMIMYDRQSESWWQQATGRSIAGDYTGAELPILPLNLLSWRQAVNLGTELSKPLEVLSQNTGYNRQYGRNPYPGYDLSNFPFLYQGPGLNEDFQPFERVLSVQHKGEWAYITFSEVATEGISLRSLAGDPILFVYTEGVSSPLDRTTVQAGRDIGSVQAFLALDGNRAIAPLLRSDGLIADQNSSGLWSKAGISKTAGGNRLLPLSSVNHFWFSWSAFSAELES